MKTFTAKLLGLAMAAVLILLAILLAGCADDADLVIPASGKSTLPFPETPDRLMANFRTAYGSQDLVNYAALLHPEFTFVKSGGGTCDRDTELKIAARMFSGEDYVKPGGVIAGIASIEVVRCEGVGEWVPVPGEEREVMSRTYLIAARFLRTNDTVLSVRGSVRFEVIRDELVGTDDVARDGWRILRQIDGT